MSLMLGNIALSLLGPMHERARARMGGTGEDRGGEGAGEEGGQDRRNSSNNGGRKEEVEIFVASTTYLQFKPCQT